MAAFTIVKLVGSGQVYTDLATWESGAPADLTTAEKWSAGTFTGTFTQGETVTGTGLTAGKFLDSDGSSYVSFGIVTGNSATLVTLTGSTSLATCVVSAKTNTGCVWQGQINASTDAFTAANVTVLTVAGGTTSATAYKDLTTKTGASFRDNASVQSNALAYNSSNGAVISNSGNNYNSTVIVQELNFRLSKIQGQCTSTGPFLLIDGNGSSTRTDFCIIETNGGQGVLCSTNGSSVASNLYNSILIQRGNGPVWQGGAQSPVAVNCTFVCPNDLTDPAAAFFTSGYVTPVMTNVAVFGFTAVRSGATGTFTTCYTDVVGPPTGFTGSISYSGAFQNITDSTRDFRLKAGSGLLDVGTTDSVNAPIDIAGTARPQGSAYDVGAWELVSGGGGATGRMLWNSQLNGLGSGGPFFNNRLG